MARVASRRGPQRMVSPVPEAQTVPYHGTDIWHCSYGCGGIMSTTLTVDDDLLAEAKRLTGLTEGTDVVREALKHLIERESARRLARLGGSEPDLKPIPRRQLESA